MLIERDPNALFVGQQDIIAEVEACLLRNGSHQCQVAKKYVLCGIGGVGKSELALQFAYRHRQEYWGIFWIDCSTLESAHRSFGQIAKRCRWEDETGDGLTKVAIRGLSNSQLPWLMVLDNCDDPEVNYAQFMPNSEMGALLITTRLQDVRAQYGANSSHTIEGLEETHAIELLLSAAGKSLPGTTDENAAAKSIVEQLGMHALAITIAASLIRRMYSLEEYSSVLQKKYAELLKAKPRQAQSTYGTIEETFEITAQRLLESGEDCDRHALELLRMLAYFDRTDIPEEIFTRAWQWGEDNQNNPDEVDADATDLQFDVTKLSSRHFELALSFDWANGSDLGPFRQARARLDELSLISWVPKADGASSISIHPVIHSWARSRLQELEKSQAWQVAAATLALSTENHGGWREYSSQLQPHLETCYDTRPPMYEDSVHEGFLCQTLHTFWWQLYRTHSGCAVLIQDELQKMVPASDIDSLEENFNANTLSILRIQALMLRKSNQNAEALDIQQRLLRVYEKTHQQHDYPLLSMKIHVAGSLSRLRRHEEAAHILEDLQEMSSGLDLQLQLSIYKDLGTVYLLLDRPEEAADILEKAAGLGPGVSRHLERFLEAQRKLARAYSNLGQFLKAIQLLEQVLVSEVKINSAGHWRYWESATLLFKSYTEVGQLSEARILHEGMAPYLQNQRPWRFVHYLESETELLIQEERIDEAVKFQKQIVERNAGTQLPGDRNRFAEECKLVSHYIGLTSYEKAGLLFSRMQEDAHLLSERDRICLAALGDKVAEKCCDNGQLDLAISLGETVVHAREMYWPPEDRDRFRSEEWLVVYYIEAKDATKARQLLDKMLVHVDTLVQEDRENIGNLEEMLCRLEHDIAMAFYDKGELDQAISLMEKVVQARAELLAPQDRNRCASEYCLVFYYIKAANPTAARRQLYKMLVHVEILAQQDREYIEKLSEDLCALEFQLAWDYYDEGRLDLATAMLEKVVETNSRFLWSGHPETWSLNCTLLLFYTKNGDTQKATRLMHSVCSPRLDRHLILDLCYQGGLGGLGLDVARQVDALQAQAKLTTLEERERWDSGCKSLLHYAQNGEARKVKEMIERGSLPLMDGVSFWRVAYRVGRSWCYL